MKKETLTSRERVIRTLNHEPVDRIPIDLGSHMSTGISAFAYWNLREYLGFSTDSIEIPDVVQFLAKVDKDILQRFHCDCLLLEPPWSTTLRWSPRDRYAFHLPASFHPRLTPDGDWIVERGTAFMRMPKDGFFFDGAWMSAGWDDDDEEDAHIALYAREAERIFKETPYATNYGGYSRGPDLGSFFHGIDHAVAMLLEPDKTMEENTRRCEESIRIFQKINRAMGPYIQLVTTDGDMGMQKGPVCRPEVFEQFCYPFYKKFCSFVHDNSDIKVFLHSCGSIMPLMPMLVDAGIDVFNPVQISADNMDPRELKARFGNQMIFWGGGCDTQNILGVKAPHEVARHVRELVRTFKPGGGFVFNQVHNIMGNVPPENIVAMLDAAYEESFYY